MFNNSKVVMVTYDDCNVFEDPEITNFQFWADPETFREYKGGYAVDGILAVDEGQQQTSSYEATLYFYTKIDSYDFYKVYHSCFTDWWFELRDPSLALIVDEGGKLRVVNASEV